MAEVASLMRERVLEKLFTREVLEIRVVDPALADALVGQAVDVLEQQQPDHETALDPRPALRAVERRDLAIDPVPVDLGGELHQLVFQVDDLVEPGTKQVAFPRRLRLLRSHRSPPLRPRNHGCRFEGISKMKSQASEALNPESLQSQNRPRQKFESPIKPLGVLHGRLIRFNVLPQTRHCLAELLSSSPIFSARNSSITTPQ